MAVFFRPPFADAGWCRFTRLEVAVSGSVPDGSYAGGGILQRQGGGAPPSGTFQPIDSLLGTRDYPCSFIGVLAVSGSVNGEAYNDQVSVRVELTPHGDGIAEVLAPGVVAQFVMAGHEGAGGASSGENSVTASVKCLG